MKLQLYQKLIMSNLIKKTKGLLCLFNFYKGKKENKTSVFILLNQGKIPTEELELR